MKMTIKDSRIFGISSLKNSPTPCLDVDALLSFSTGREKSFLLAHQDDEIEKKSAKKFFGALRQRQKGLPVAYITGHKEFFALEFLVTKKVLIPKPDTETLVERALEWIENFGKDKIEVCDVCAGSGCVGISILKNAKKIVKLTMTDISSSALRVAKKNARSLLSESENERTKFSRGDLLRAVKNPKKFSLVVSNPPYIKSRDVDALLRDGRREPRLALDGDRRFLFSREKGDGLFVARRLVKMSAERIESGGALIMECGEDNINTAAEFMESAGFVRVKIHEDLSGKQRVVSGEKR